MVEFEKREPDPEFDWPFDQIRLSEPARVILERFWYQISQRRPFKHDFPDMYEKELEEFNQMFLDIARTIDGVVAEQIKLHGGT